MGREVNDHVGDPRIGAGVYHGVVLKHCNSTLYRCMLLSVSAWYKLEMSDTFVRILLLVIPSIVKQECMLTK